MLISIWVNKLKVLEFLPQLEYSFVVFLLEFIHTEYFESLHLASIYPLRFEMVFYQSSVQIGGIFVGVERFWVSEYERLE